MRKNFALPIAALLTACGQTALGNTSADATITNATEDYEATVEDADTRADRLDGLANNLTASAKQRTGAERAAMLNEANADFAAAADIRRQGQAQGASEDEAVDRGAGLLNGQ